MSRENQFASYSSAAAAAAGAPFSFHGEPTPRMKTHETRVGYRRKKRPTRCRQLRSRGRFFPGTDVSEGDAVEEAVAEIIRRSAERR